MFKKSIFGRYVRFIVKDWGNYLEPCLRVEVLIENKDVDKLNSKTINLNDNNTSSISETVYLTEHYYTLRDFDNCIKYANIVIWKDNTNKYGYYFKGCALKEMNKLNEALESFEKALRIDPNYADANIKKSKFWN